MSAIARAVRADLSGARAAEALTEQLGDDQWLLLLDNFEQVVDAAGDLGELLARCPAVAILATSRTVLGLQAEREYPVPPLPLAADPAGVPIEELAASPAVALFVDRARAVRPGFALTQGNARAVAELCRRLEGLPLAIELAAARSRLLDPDAILRRLETSLDALGTGAVDLPDRQRTLRATVDWSVGLLDDTERSLLEVVAVFEDGWTVEAAAQVAGLDEDWALELTEALARHSLIQLDVTDDSPRCRMLGTVRAFVAERLEARSDAAAVARRHADYYRALAEQADRPLRSAGQNVRAERPDAEAGNLARAVRWYLANDPGPLPHLFRILVPFWELRDHLAEARLLGERFDNAGLTAGSRILLGTLAIVRGRLEEARALLDEGLDLSLAAHTSRNVTLCMAAFALLAFVEGDPERAALLAGAADGLRRRAALGVWPLLRREEAALVAQVRQALGAERFDQVFAAGSRLNQREAVAAVRDRRPTLSR